MDTTEKFDPPKPIQSTSQDNPLKKMQSFIALCNKLIWILFGTLKKGLVFCEDRMLADIPRFASEPVAA
jgi:transposase